MNRTQFAHTRGRRETAFTEFEAAGAALPVDSLTAAQTLTVIELRERGHRRDVTLEHALTARLIDQANPRDFGATSIRELLANRLRISQKEARDRLTDAAQLGPRHTITGDRLPPDLAHTAAAVARGDIGRAHVRIIQDFVKKLPV